MLGQGNSFESHQSTDSINSAEFSDALNMQPVSL